MSTTKEAEDGINGGVFCSTAEMIERIRDVLSWHIEIVHDWHIADVLRLSPANLASRKMRDAPPFKEIILFCDRCGLDPMKIIMKKSC